MNSLRQFVRTVGNISDGGREFSSVDEVLCALKEAVGSLPLSFVERSRSSISSVSPAETSELLVDVPSTIDVSKLKTTSDLRFFVENSQNGLLLWGGALHSNLRKVKWQGRFATENRRLNQILSSYCYVRFVNFDGAVVNKQELGKKARAVLIQQEGDLAKHYDSVLSTKYLNIYEKDGWYGVAAAIKAAEAATS